VHRGIGLMATRSSRDHAVELVRARGAVPRRSRTIGCQDNVLNDGSHSPIGNLRRTCQEEPHGAESWALSRGAENILVLYAAGNMILDARKEDGRLLGSTIGSNTRLPSDATADIMQLISLTAGCHLLDPIRC